MFEVILFSLVAFSGVVILFCKFVIPELYKRDPEPWYLDYARSFFPVLLIVFVLRGFVAEPFRIPSGSMLPTLEVGDFILVNKYKYGIRLPVFQTKIFEVSDPKRGDIMVFRVPKDNKTNYIKRVIGVPGDTIVYQNKQLFINGELVENVDDGSYTPFPVRGKERAIKRFKQVVPTGANNDTDTNNTENVEFSILHDPQRFISKNRSVKVPEGHYFVLGDNRDHSADSRYWGFVPDENVVGNAFFIWFHYNTSKGGGTKFSRIGENI